MLLLAILFGLVQVSATANIDFPSPVDLRQVCLDIKSQDSASKYEEWSAILDPKHYTSDKIGAAYFGELRKELEYLHKLKNRSSVSCDDWPAQLFAVEPYAFKPEGAKSSLNSNERYSHKFEFLGYYEVPQNSWLDFTAQLKGGQTLAVRGFGRYGGKDQDLVLLGTRRPDKNGVVKVLVASKKTKPTSSVPRLVGVKRNFNAPAPPAASPAKGTTTGRKLTTGPVNPAPVPASAAGTTVTKPKPTLKNVAVAVMAANRFRGSTQLPPNAKSEMPPPPVEKLADEQEDKADEELAEVEETEIGEEDQKIEEPEDEEPKEDSAEEEEDGAPVEERSLVLFENK